MDHGEGACGKRSDDGGKNVGSVNVGGFLVGGSRWQWDFESGVME